MRLEALELVERRQIGVIVIEMHDEADRETVERLIRDTGLNPVYLGPGQYDLLDQILRLWFTLVNAQGRGRHLAFKVL